MRINCIFAFVRAFVKCSLFCIFYLKFFVSTFFRLRKMEKKDESNLRIKQILLFNVPVAVVAALSICIWIINAPSDVSPLRYCAATVVPFICAGIGYKRRSLDYSGFLAAIAVGFALTISNYCFSTSLIVLFFSTSSATKFRSNQKKLIEEDFKEGGNRNWLQVVCNGGVAAEMALLYAYDIGLKEVPVNFISNYNASWLSMAVLGSLACCCGDTFASELGPVLQWGEPRLITTFKKVKKGTNGGVSLPGLIASAVGGLIVGVTYYLTLLLSINHRLLHKSPPQWPIVLQAILCGFIGSLIDSLLGATLQFSGYDDELRKVVEHPGPSVKPICGRPLLSNHTVNLAAGFLTAMLSPFLAYNMWPLFT